MTKAARRQCGPQWVVGNAGTKSIVASAHANRRLTDQGRSLPCNRRYCQMPLSVLRERVGCGGGRSKREAAISRERLNTRSGDPCEPGAEGCTLHAPMPAASQCKSRARKPTVSKWQNRGCANYFVQAVVASSGYNPQAALELHPALALARLVLDPPSAALPTHSRPPLTSRPTLGSTFLASRAVGCAFRALTPSRKLPSPCPPCILRPHPGRLLTTEASAHLAQSPVASLSAPPSSQDRRADGATSRVCHSPRFILVPLSVSAACVGCPGCPDSSEYTSHPFPALRLRSAAYHCCFGTVTTPDQDWNCSSIGIGIGITATHSCCSTSVCPTHISLT